MGEGSIDGADESTFDSIGVMEGSKDDCLDGSAGRLGDEKMIFFMVTWIVMVILTVEII